MLNNHHFFIWGKSAKKLLEQMAILALFYLLVWYQVLHAGTEKDLASMTEMNAVVLLSESELNVVNSGLAYYKEHQRILINTPAGKKYGEFTVGESKFVRTKKINGKILTVTGEEIEKLKKEDIFVDSNLMDFQLYSDSKTASVSLSHNTIPYVVDFSYEQELKSLFFWPPWIPASELPVLKAVYRLELPPDLQYRHYSIGLDLEPKISVEKGKKVLIWQLDSLAAIVKESYMPMQALIQKAILFAPVEFKLDRYSGSFASWSEFGNWYNQLCAGRTQLPPNTRAEIGKLLSETDTELQKVQKLYRFIQDYTRYVSIDLGIGGWQPYPAAEVYNNRYGDCKDLSNLLIALLAEANIHAYPAIIGTRSTGGLFRDFPYPLMNHVLVYVPLANDTLWLESTSDLEVAGELPYEIEGCDALVVGDDGGRVVRTPESQYQDNTWASRIEGTLAINGALNLKGQIITTGEKSGFLRSELYYLKPEEQKNWFHGRLGHYIPKLELKAHEFSHLNDNLEQPIQAKFAGIASGFATRTSNRLFFNPNMLHRVSAADLPQAKERRFPIEYDYSYQELDTLVIVLPSDYEIESAPEPVLSECSFARVEIGYTYANNTLYYYRNLIWRQRQLPASAFPEYLDLLQNLVRSDKSQFVLKKR